MVRRSEVWWRASLAVVSLAEVFDLAFVQLHGPASGGEQKGALLAKVYSPAFDSLAEAPNAHVLSQGTVQVSPVFENSAEVLDPVQLGVEVREQSAEQV